MSLFDTVLDKTKVLVGEYDKRKRAQKEDRLNLKEGDLKAKEKALEDKERELQARAASLTKREKAVARKERRPLYVLVLCVILFGALFGWLWHNYDFTKRVQQQTTSASATDKKP